MGPTRYRIVVRGRLGNRLAALFHGLDYEEGGGESALIGSLDQSGLHGVLRRLFDLGIDLVRVNPDE